MTLCSLSEEEDLSRQEQAVFDRTGGNVDYITLGFGETVDIARL